MSYFCHAVQLVCPLNLTLQVQVTLGQPQYSPVGTKPEARAALLVTFLQVCLNTDMCGGFPRPRLTFLMSSISYVWVSQSQEERERSQGKRKEKREQKLNRMESGKSQSWREEPKRARDILQVNVDYPADRRGMWDSYQVGTGYSPNKYRIPTRDTRTSSS